MVDIRILGLIHINIIYIGRRCSWLGGHWAGRLHRLWTWYLPASSRAGGRNPSLSLRQSAFVSLYLKIVHYQTVKDLWIVHTLRSIWLSVHLNWLIPDTLYLNESSHAASVGWGVMLGFVRGCFQNYVLKLVMSSLNFQSGYDQNTLWFWIL